MFGLDLIRATAIILVLFAHTFPGGNTFPLIGAVRTCWGYWGVEIFFVLSGFLIGGILIASFNAGRLTSLGEVLLFWKRRWFRTLPNYFLFLAVFLAMSWLDDGRLPAGWGKYLWFGQALLSDHPPFFALVWSLAIEEWFYLLFPILLLGVSKLVSRRGHALLVTIAVFLVVPPILRWLLQTDQWDVGVRKVTLPRLDAITYGVCLAFIKSQRPAVWNRLVKYWPAGAVAAAGVFGHAWLRTFVAGGFTADSIFFRVFYFCLISASIALLFPKIATLTAPACWWETCVRKMSLWSYSIYLNHIFCVWLVSAGYDLLHWQARPGSGLLLLHHALVWLVAIPFAAMIYQFYEKPVMDLRDRAWWKRDGHRLR